MLLISHQLSANNRDVRFAAVFGTWLKRVREGAGLTQPELAERLGLGQSFVGQLENGLRNPSVETVEQVLAEFSVGLPAWFREMEGYANKPEQPVEAAPSNDEMAPRRKRRAPPPSQPAPRPQVQFFRIAAGNGVEPIKGLFHELTDDQLAQLDAKKLTPKSVFAVHVVGDSMDGDDIVEGDVALMRRIRPRGPHEPFPRDTIYAVYIESADEGRLKRVRLDEKHKRMILVSSNKAVADAAFDADDVKVVAELIAWAKTGQRKKKR